MSAAAPIEPAQVQPASLDLRLGAEAYRVRASFLPGPAASVAERLKSLNPERVSLFGEGAVLEKGIVYIAPLMERLALPITVSGAANPKSSTGRLDIFTRLIVDGSDAFDYVPAGYSGPLFAEISPRSFSVRVRAGTRLNQLRFRQGAAMDGPDYAHWHGSFQVVQIFKNMQQIYDYRIKHGKIEEMTTVMTVGSL